MQSFVSNYETDYNHQHLIGLPVYIILHMLF